ncbi:alpha/beta fold hydrolase [Hamadaea tsunoensis]|uniref:alpha/beta fold hydrolase n=1 Tax=Hamadaea tsunoensis TaxID=53368 RepID=UPI0003FE0E65|nr:alpha/beta hydrolase [Hamadaea tsunoensis]
MREVPGQLLPVNGRTVYVEQSGRTGDPGQPGAGKHVVFEAGSGCGRTFWDPLLPLLADEAHLVTYDRAGRVRTGPLSTPLTVDGMADDLVALVDAVVPGDFVLVAHSLGGLVTRRAAERLGTRLRGLLLIDTLPENSPVYDEVAWAKTTQQVDRVLAVGQALSRFRPLGRLFSANVRPYYSADTYETMLAEDFTPAGTAQTRREMQAVAAAIPQFRADPPKPPACPAILLSAAKPAKGRERQNALTREHQRRYAESLPDCRYESVDSAHLVQAEQPELVAARIRELLAHA